VLRNTRPLQEALDAPAFTRSEYAYQLLGYVLNSGSMLEHLRQNMLGGTDYAELGRLAAEPMATPGHVYVLPTALANGSRSRMSLDPYTVAGLTDLSSFGGIWRAGLEAFALAIHGSAPLDDEVQIFAAGGGAANAQWRQITGDVMGRAQRYFPRASTCLGAAAVAAQAAGAAHSAVELAATWLGWEGAEATVPRARAAAEYDAAIGVWRRLRGVAGNEPIAG
jgi:sugar (pentulose or hexulose) kinase